MAEAYSEESGMRHTIGLSKPYGFARLRSQIRIGAVVLSGAVVACQATPAAPPDPTGKAILRAYGAGVGNWLAMALKPIGESHEVLITSVNGVDPKTFGNARQILLPPGQYVIGVRCHFVLDSLQVSTLAIVTADVVAGHAYLVDGALSARDHKDCIGSVVDTTSGSK